MGKSPPVNGQLTEIANWKITIFKNGKDGKLM
jgi:hypothetical protein